MLLQLAVNNFNMVSHMHTHILCVELLDQPQAGCIQDVKHDNVTVTYIDNVKENKCLHENRLVLFMIQYEF